MDTSAGPYPVTTLDPSYRAIVGYLGNCGYYFRVLDTAGDEVDGGGLDGELPHLVKLMEAANIYVDWTAEVGLIAELARHDPALHSKVPTVVTLLHSVLAASSLRELGCAS